MLLNRIFQLDLPLLTWSADFLAAVSPSPGDYGLSAQQVSDYATTQGRYAIAIAKVRNRGSKTITDTVVKTSTKASLVNASRMLVDVCDAWPEMTDEKRSLLNIPIRKGTNTPATLPAAAPTVTALLSGPESIRLSVRDPADANRRAKPKGVASVLVQVCFADDGAEPATPATEWPTHQIAGRADVDLYFANMPAGKTAWVACSWLSTRNERGPVSRVLSIRLPGSGFASRPASAEQGPAMKIAA